MDDKQKEHLSALEVGNAIVFSEHTEKPIHVHIKQVSDTSEKQIKNELVRTRFLEKKDSLGNCYEYLEVAGVITLFTDVAKDISKMQVDAEKNKKLIKKIGDISKQYQKNEDEVWKKLLLRYDNVSGKALSEDISQEERVNLLVKFFSETFTKDSFNSCDINENYDCIFQIM